MSIIAPVDIFAQRPLHARSFFVQAEELRLDPLHKSPPEAAVGHALLRLMLDPDEFGSPSYANLFFPTGEIKSPDEMPPIKGRKLGVINVAPGCWVDRYQADYLFEAKAPGSTRIARGALECDGYMYHDKTPEQAAHDRKRDRDFQAGGIIVLRFPAYEIHDRPDYCAREAINVLLRRSAA